MRALTAILVLTLASLLPAGAPPPSGDAAPAPPGLRIMSYNLRYDNPKDGIDAWPRRREAVLSAIRFHRADLLCLQEGLDHQVAYLAGSLGWTPFGVGRNDGRKDGEYAAILYDARRFTQLEGGYFWLSPTPERPGKGWDAASIRIATWLKLKDGHGQPFLVLNTHMDDQGIQARREGARLIIRRLQELAQGLPMLVTGDFNAGPGSEVCAMLAQAGLTDALTLSELPHHGPLRTFWGFNPQRPERAEGDRIDFLFVSAGIRVKAHGILADLTPEGHFASDHLPVLAEVVVPAR